MLRSLPVISKHRKSAISCALLLLATVYATALQIYWGTAPYYGYDELWHTALAAVSPPWVALQLISADVHPPLHYLLVRPLTRIGGDPFFPRLASIIPSILSVPLWFLLMRKLRIHTAVALTTTLVLVLSFSYQHIGIMVRSYSLAVFLLLAAVWFWIDLLPGSRGRPSRWSAVLSLALFTAAFWTLYVSVLVTASVMAATLLSTLLDRKQRHSIITNWRNHSGWPEWLAFIAFHLLAILWMWWGRHQHGSTTITDHINPLLPSPGQPPLDYVIAGLQQQLALFSPLFDASNLVANTCLWLLLATIIGLLVYGLKRGSAAAAVVALTPLLLTALLATAGLLSVYPFGGTLRHQYILFPFLLLLLPLSLNALWPRLPNDLLKGLLLIGVTAMGVHSSIRSHADNFSIGDAPLAPFWGDELKTLFARGSDSVVVTPAYSSYATFMDRWVQGVHYRNAFDCDGSDCRTAAQGFKALIQPWPDFMEFEARADDGGEIRFLRYLPPTLSTLPTPAFFDMLKGTLTAMGKTRARIFSPDTNHQPNHDQQALRERAQQHGFKLTEFQPLNTSVLWSLELIDQPPPATTSSAMNAALPTTQSQQAEPP